MTSKPPAIPERKTWFFTFGVGKPNAGRYFVVRDATYGEARERMLNAFGREWAFQYDDAGWTKNGMSQAEKYGLKEIRLTAGDSEEQRPKEQTMTLESIDTLDGAAQAEFCRRVKTERQLSIALDILRSHGLDDEYEETLTLASRGQEAGNNLRLACCYIDCEAVAEFEIITLRSTGEGERLAGPDPYSDQSYACADHVGDLLGHQPSASNPQHIFWRVSPVTDEVPGSPEEQKGKV